MVTFIVVLAIVLSIIILKYYLDSQKDESDLEFISFDKKVEIIVNKMNDWAFKGQGEVTVTGKKSFNLYKENDNLILHFTYSTGGLMIVARYKFLQKEIQKRCTFQNIRNIDYLGQVRIAEHAISEFNKVIGEHQNKILNGLI